MRDFYKLLKKLLKQGFTIGGGDLEALILGELDFIPNMSMDGSAIVLEHKGTKIKIKFKLSEEYEEYIVYSLTCSY